MYSRQIFYAGSYRADAENNVKKYHSDIRRFGDGELCRDEKLILRIISPTETLKSLPLNDYEILHTLPP